MKAVRLNCFAGIEIAPVLSRAGAAPANRVISDARENADAFATAKARTPVQGCQNPQSQAHRTLTSGRRLDPDIGARGVGRREAVGAGDAPGVGIEWMGAAAAQQFALLQEREQVRKQAYFR